MCQGDLCEDRVATGAGWGVSDLAGGFWAVYDCTQRMLDLVAIATLNDSASVKTDCAATRCMAN